MFLLEDDVTLARRDEVRTILYGFGGRCGERELVLLDNAHSDAGYR